MISISVYSGSSYVMPQKPTKQLVEVLKEECKGLEIQNVAIFNTGRQLMATKAILVYGFLKKYPQRYVRKSEEDLIVYGDEEDLIELTKGPQ